MQGFNNHHKIQTSATLVLRLITSKKLTPGLMARTDQANWSRNSGLIGNLEGQGKVCLHVYRCVSVRVRGQ